MFTITRRHSAIKYEEYLIMLGKTAISYYIFDIGSFPKIFSKSAKENDCIESAFKKKIYNFNEAKVKYIAVYEQFDVYI